MCIEVLFTLKRSRWLASFSGALDVEVAVEVDGLLSISEKINNRGLLHFLQNMNFKIAVPAFAVCYVFTLLLISLCVPHSKEGERQLELRDSRECGPFFGKVTDFVFYSFRMVSDKQTPREEICCRK